MRRLAKLRRRNKVKPLKTVWLIGVLAIAGCSSAPPLDAVSAEAEIRDVLAVQDAAWNSGDIDGFMEHYIKSEDLRFASGGNINRGWQATIDGYKTRYPDKSAMGTLSFTDLEVDVLSPDNALVFGHWKLTRAADMHRGLFTLHMKRVDGQWVIVSDHTSSAE